MKNYSKKIIALAISLLMSFFIGGTSTRWLQSSIIVHAEDKTMVMDCSWYIGHEDEQEYTITKPEQLEALRTIVANLSGSPVGSPISFEGKTIKLGNDIDFSGYIKDDGTDFLFAGIGNANNNFKGTFDGCGYSIKNWKHTATINGGSKVTRGIFCFATDATIKNLNVIDIDMQELKNPTSYGVPSDRAMTTKAGEGVAGIVAVGENVTIMKCNVTGTISNCNYRTGGIIGQAISCTVEDCNSKVVIETDRTDDNWGRYSGGIVGRALDSKITNCSFSGKIDGNIYVGGIAGAINGDNALITNCIVEEEAVITDHSSTNGFAGGIVGVSQSNIVGCANHANVTVTAGNVSGIAAGDKGPYTFTNTQTFEIKNSYSDGKAQVGESTDCQIRSAANNASYTNVAYLADNGNASPDGDINGATGFTAEQYKNREVVDFLNGEDTPVWFQNVDHPDFANNMIPVTDITSDDTATVDKDQEIALTVSVTPDDATNPALTFKSSDEEVATVDADGKVKGIKAGEADITITALYDGTEKVCKVTVKDPAAEKEKADKEAADKVIEIIKGIDVTKATEAQLKAVQEAYNALTDDQKKLVDADSEAAEAMKKIDAKVEEMEKESSSPDKKDSTTVAVKKGATFTVKGYKYKVTSNLKKNPTVTVTGYKNKKLKKIVVPASVKYMKITFKVTAIGKSAFKGQKKAKTAVIGNNVKNIGATAFAGDAKCKKIIVKTAVLEKVGAKALKGINKKAVVKVPAKKLKVYKKLFKGKGQAKTVKVKK